jgi:hypothetical protein
MLTGVMLETGVPLSAQSGAAELIVTPERHGKLGWRRVENLRFARSLAIQPLAADELPRVAQSIPVGLTRDRGRWVAAAIFSNLPGQNLYVTAEGRWRAAFVPAALRTYPFRLSSDRPDALALWPCYKPVPLDDSCEPFFLDGKLQPVLESTFQFLRTVRSGIHALAEPLDFLAGHGVLTEWDLSPDTRDGGAAGLTDIWRLDPQRLESLSEPAWLTLRRMGALPWSYAHLASIHHAAGFKRLADIPAQPPSVLASPPRREAAADRKAEDFLAMLAADMSGADA